jgi:hypothetical protein
LEATIHALPKSGIERLIGSDEFYREDSPLTQEILKELPLEIGFAHTRTPGRRTRIQFIGSILARMGYEWIVNPGKKTGVPLGTIDA